MIKVWTILLRRTKATEVLVVDEGVAAVDVAAAEEELVEHPEVVDPVEVAEEAEVVAEEEAVVVVHPGNFQMFYKCIRN